MAGAFLGTGQVRSMAGVVVTSAVVTGAVTLLFGGRLF